MLDEAITATRLAEAAEVHVPDTGDKTTAKDIQDLKSMFVKLIAKSSAGSGQPTVGNVTPTPTATTTSGPPMTHGTTATSATQPQPPVVTPYVLPVQYVVPTTTQQSVGGHGRGRGRGREPGQGR